MALIGKMNPSQYIGVGGGLAGTTSTGVGLAFGFNATHIRIKNEGDGVGTVYFSLGTTGIATSEDMPLSSGETFDSWVPQCAGLGLATATESTGDGVSVLALG